MAAAEASTAPRTYGNWQRPTSAGLGRLGSIGTAILLVGLIVVVLVMMVGGLLRGVIALVVLGLLLLAIVTRDRHGRNVIDRATARVMWRSARSRGAHLYRSGPLGFALWGTHQLPGLAAQLRLSEHIDSYGRPFALVHCPATSTYTVVIGTDPDGASLVDPEQVDVWVADWGHWLANLGDEPGVEAASVTVETAPDSGLRLRREVESNIDNDAPTFAKDMLRQVVRDYPMGSSVINAYVAISFSAASLTSGKRRTDAEIGRDLAARLPQLTGSLTATGAGAGRPLSAGDLCEVIRVAYDPAAAILVDEAHADGDSTDLSWADVGPAAAEASWDSYAHDDAHSVTWAMTVAPRGAVQSSVLSRLLAPHADIARKRVTLLYRPIDAARAAGIVESDLRSAEFKVTATDKPSARSILANRAAAATAAEEASGAGLVNFGLLVTATVLDPSDAAKARAAIDYLSASARLRLRPVYGAQDSAFAAGLPLGLILPKHLKVPADLRGRL